MKILFFFSLALLVTQVAAQDKLSGVGKFKIGVSTQTLVDDISGEFGYSVDTLHTYEEYYSARDKYPKIYKLIRNNGTVANLPPNSSACEDVDVFYVNKYTIAGIPIKDAFLTYRKGVLVKFDCEITPDFEDALKVKYGDPKLLVKTKQIKCTYSLTGATVSHEERTYTSTWVGLKVVGTATLMEYYSDDCKKQYLHIFKLGNDITIDQINECDRIKSAKIDKAKELIQKRKLSEF